MELARRDDFPALLNELGLLGHGAEVGVRRGRFSEYILKHWKGEHLLSVDPWLAFPADDYVDPSNVSQERHDQFYGETKRRLEIFGERSTVWRSTSVEAASRLEPRSLDFAYLDARHDYESVKEDLEQWFDKVRPGGILAGHDYMDGHLRGGDYGVKSAVDEFFAKRGFAVQTTSQDPPLSWFVLIA